MNTWQNGCFGKIEDLPIHTTPSHHNPKMDVLPKTFPQIILAAKCLVRHSSTSPSQQRRPLPSLLSNFSSIVTVYHANRSVKKNMERIVDSSDIVQF